MCALQGLVVEKESIDYTTSVGEKSLSGGKDRQPKGRCANILVFEGGWLEGGRWWDPPNWEAETPRLAVFL